MKWTIIEKKYALRSITKKDFNVPEKPKLKRLDVGKLLYCTSN